MPRKTKTPLPAIPAELLDQFGNGPMTAETIHAATLALKKALIERALAGELNHHLGYSPGAAKPAAVTNQRNGKGSKTVLTEDGPMRIKVPHDRDGSFEPILIPWGQTFPPVTAAWRHAWDRVIAFFAFPPAVRKVIDTTHAIENVKAQLRKIIKTRGRFPSDEAATKLIWLALRNITAKWSRSGHDWKTAMNQFAILYEERFIRPSA